MTGKSAADTWGADTWVAGVDGCPGGWLVAFVRAAASEVRLRIVPQFAEVLAAAESAAVIAIEIPIGLPARAGRGGRAPERLVRPLLGERQSSVFSVPSRAALAAADYRKACAVALATSDPPRKISKQLFMIAPKIRAVDQSLRMDPQRLPAPLLHSVLRKGARGRSPIRPSAMSTDCASRSGHDFGDNG